MDLYDLLELGYFSDDFFNSIQTYITEIDKFKLRPSDRENFIKMIQDKDFREALFKDKTKEFEEEHKEGCSEKNSFVYEVIGKKGRGKTTLMKILQNKTREYHSNIKTEILFNIQVILERIKEYGLEHPHSVFGSDEPIKVSGEGKILAKEALENVIQMCREFAINFIFNVKRFVYVENIDDYLMLFGFNKDTQETRCLWLSDKGKPMGIVIFTKNFTEEEHKVDSEAKRKKFEQLLNNLGRDGIYDIEEEKEKCVEYLEDKRDKINHISDVKYFIYKEFHYPRNILMMLGRQVFNELKFSEEKGINEEKSFLSNPLGVSVKDFKLIDIQKFNDKYIEKAIKICEITEKEKQLLQLKIVKKLGSKQLIKALKSKAFSQNFHIYNSLKQCSPKLGLSMELAFVDFLQDSGMNFEYFGGRINSLDVINYTNKQVIELKTVYREKDRLNHIYKINLEEFQKANELNFDLVYCVVILELKEVQYYKYIRGSEEKNGEF